MAKPELQKNLKFSRLIRGLRLPRNHVYGILAMLWDFVYEQGDPYVGDREDVEEICGWDGTPGVLFEALLDPTASKTSSAGFIEPIPGKEGKYRVHALYEHAPEYVRRKMERKGTAPMDEVSTKPRRTPPKKLQQNRAVSDGNLSANYGNQTVNESHLTVSDGHRAVNGRSLPTQPNPTQPNQQQQEPVAAKPPSAPPAAELLLPLKVEEGQSPELLLRQEGVAEDAIVQLRGMDGFTLPRVVAMVNNARYLQKTRRLTGSRGGYLRAAIAQGYEPIPEAQPKADHPQKIAAEQESSRRRHEAEQQRAVAEMERAEQAALIEAASAEEITAIVAELQTGFTTIAARAYAGKTVHDCPGLARLVAGKLTERRAKNGVQHESQSANAGGSTTSRPTPPPASPGEGDASNPAGTARRATNAAKGHSRTKADPPASA